MTSTNRFESPRTSVLVLAACAALSASCASQSTPAAEHADKTGTDLANDIYGRFAKLPEHPKAGATDAFWKHWGDGKGELSGYGGKISRYGHLRPVRVALVYVTETMNRKTWVKDGTAKGTERVPVMKLNHSVKFQTGIYPYSVLTSVFSPVEDWGTPRFQPVKITATTQEWCGNFFMGLWPGPNKSLREVHSYFDGEADKRDIVETPPGTLYQDALLIQLRELQGPFAGGKDWHGKLVPSLWFRRSMHRVSKPVDATIKREDAEFEGKPVTRFTLHYVDKKPSSPISAPAKKGEPAKPKWLTQGGDVTVTYDVEKAQPHRILHWHRSDGSDFRLLKTTRLPYWGLHDPGNEHYREQMGLAPVELSTPDVAPKDVAPKQAPSTPDAPAKQ